MKLFYVALFFFLVVVSACFASDRKYMEQGHISQLNDDWYFTQNKPARNERLTFSLALKQQNTDRLEEIFNAVSDPTSSEYGNHLTVDEITELVAPKQSTIDTVLQWLSSEGVTDHTMVPNKDFINIETTLAVAERLFGVEFHEIKHSKSDARLVRAHGPYTVPTHVAEHLDFVSGVIAHPVSRKDVAGEPDASNPSLTPTMIRKQYKVPSNLMVTNSKSTMAVAEFQGQYYSPSDLSTFFTKFGPVGNYNQKVAKVVGTNKQNDPGVEASLDIQYIMGVGLNATTWFYSIASFDFFKDLTQWASEIANDQDAPLVHSVSYGSQHYYGQPSSDYKHRLDNEFKKLGARGISILFASGDSGSGCHLCYEGVPSYPATSSYVTSVGATRLLNGGVGPEGAVKRFRSGGGFSLKAFDRPSYQNYAVSQWLQHGRDIPGKKFFNRKGRGTPDVSALGVGYQVVANGRVENVAGTSASTPTFAGIVTLLNDARLNQGMKPLGFLNPFLYQTWKSQSNSFNDVTEGKNPSSCCDGFKCSKGWDPVTGVGTPNFGVLKDAALNQ
eukprot:gb/GECH01011148.1/.p1 GENE.gb/GECH01011148.1/~~gb/GECH01011148.1/.p1  ORF type:complete len:557 (+),score=103.76 gb/GECH01011148.1/:1-1671(+)